MKRIDSGIILGEFKVWIYQNYFAPSIHFILCVSVITPSQLASIQRQVTRFLKSWLNLPRCVTLASIFYPKSLGIKHLPRFHELVQLTPVQTVEFSLDPLVQNSSTNFCTFARALHSQSPGLTKGQRLCVIQRHQQLQTPSQKSQSVCALKHLAPHCSKGDRYQLRDNLSRSVIASSYTIFKANRSPTWNFNSPLQH